RREALAKRYPHVEPIPERMRTANAVGTGHRVLEIMPPLVHEDVPVKLLGVHAVRPEQEQLVVAPVERGTEFARVDVLRLAGRRRVVDAPVDVERLEIDDGILGKYQPHAAVDRVEYRERRRRAGGGVTRAAPPGGCHEIPNLVGAARVETAAVEDIEGTLLERNRVGRAGDVVPHI